MQEIKMKNYPPEKLNIWDRIFNRYKTIPVEEGEEDWTYYHKYNPFDKRYSQRSYVVYHKIDRLTGGYEVIKEYLN